MCKFVFINWRCTGKQELARYIHSYIYTYLSISAGKKWEELDSWVATALTHEPKTPGYRHSLPRGGLNLQLLDFEGQAFSRLFSSATFEAKPLHLLFSTAVGELFFPSRSKGAELAPSLSSSHLTEPHTLQLVLFLLALSWLPLSPTLKGRMATDWIVLDLWLGD